MILNVLSYGKESEKMKNKLKKMLSTNIALKVVSLFLAFLLWLVVSNSQNAIQTKSVKVDINYTNEEALQDAGYIVTSRQTSIVITVEVRKNDYYKVTADNFVATADLSKHMGEDLSSQLVKVQVETTGEEENVIKNWNYPKDGPWITVKMDELQTKEMEVELVQTGAVDNSYVLNKEGLTMEPQTVTVSGPKSEFGSLTAVKAQVDLAQFSPENTEMTLPLALYDANNNVIESENLILDPSQVVVRAGVKQLKEVGITFEGVSGEPGAGYGYSQISCDTTTIALAGLKASLAEISSITIPKDALDITGATQTIERDIDITSYLPDGVEVYSNNVITVEIVIEKLETKTYQVPESQINWIGKLDQYGYHIASGEVSVELRAFEEDLDGLDVSQIQLNADVSGLGVGTHTVVFTVNVSDAFSVVEQPTARLQVTLSKDSNSSVSSSEISSEKEEVDDTENITNSTSSSESSSNQEQESSKQEYLDETKSQESSSQDNSSRETVSDDENTSSE